MEEPPRTLPEKEAPFIGPRPPSPWDGLPAELSTPTINPHIPMRWPMEMRQAHLDWLDSQPEEESK